MNRKCPPRRLRTRLSHISTPYNVPISHIPSNSPPPIFRHFTYLPVSWSRNHFHHHHLCWSCYCYKRIRVLLSRCSLIINASMIWNFESYAVRSAISTTTVVFLLLLLLFLFRQPVHKSLRLCRFKTDRDEIWQDCSSSRLCIDWRIRISYDANEASVRRICSSVRQFVIHSTFVDLYLLFLLLL